MDRLYVENGGHMLLVPLMLAPDVPDEMNLLFAFVRTVRTLELPFLPAFQADVRGKISLITIHFPASFAGEVPWPIARATG